MTVVLKEGQCLDDRYQIVQCLGRGGAGVVYKAFDIALNRTVAIKLLYPSLFGDERSRARFQREAQITSSFTHAAIVRCYASGSVGGTHYIVLDFVDGVTLMDHLERGAMDWRRVIAIGMQVCDALTYAHGHGVIHRDLSPKNIMLCGLDGKELVRILDFGLAKISPHSMLSAQKLTQTGLIVGTPHYISPEVLTGEHASPRSDIYSLGRVLAECLHGQLLRYQQEFGQPELQPDYSLKSLTDPVPTTPANLSEVLATATDVDPSLRYESADEMKEALASVLASPKFVAGAGWSPKKELKKTATKTATTTKAVKNSYIFTLLACLILGIAAASYVFSIHKSESRLTSNTANDPVWTIVRQLEHDKSSPQWKARYHLILRTLNTRHPEYPEQSGELLVQIGLKHQDVITEEAAELLSKNLHTNPEIYTPKAKLTGATYLAVYYLPSRLALGRKWAEESLSLSHADVSDTDWAILLQMMFDASRDNPESSALPEARPFMEMLAQKCLNERAKVYSEKGLEYANTLASVACYETAIDNNEYAKSLNDKALQIYDALNANSKQQAFMRMAQITKKELERRTVQ